MVQEVYQNLADSVEGGVGAQAGRGVDQGNLRFGRGPAGRYPFLIWKLKLSARDFAADAAELICTKMQAPKAARW